MKAGRQKVYVMSWMKKSEASVLYIDTIWYYNAVETKKIYMIPIFLHYF